MRRGVEFQRIGIVGLGLIGGSVALAVRRVRPETTIVGVDVDEEIVRQALSRRVADEASTDLATLDRADLVVFAAPVLANARLLAALAGRAGQAALVTDVGSTKRDIVAAARQAGLRDRFVGGHPLAGAAAGGLAHASAGLFDARPWLLTPDLDTPPANVARLEQFVRGLGAVPRRMDAGEHDRVMAAVSHLPQLAASALMHVAGELAGAEGLALAGKGLADTTRLASSPPGVWRDVCTANADCLAPALTRLIETLQALRDDLPHGDRLEEVFSKAQQWRGSMLE